MEEKTGWKISIIKTLIQKITSGGENGIRTHERIAPLHAFQACAFNHSATSPSSIFKITQRSIFYLINFISF